MIKIRGSLLSGYFDCPRRSAIQIIPSTIESAGFGFTKKPSSISNIIGKAVHAGGQYIINELKNSIITDGLEASVEHYSKALKENEVMFDETTRNNDTAIKQVKQLVGFYQNNIIPFIDIETVETEKPISIKINHDIEITGTIDITDKKQIRDLKTGRKSNYMAQLGHYSLIERAKGAKPRPLYVDFLTRTALNKPFPGVSIHQYDIGTAERCAISVSNAIASHVEQFEKTGDPWSFPANPKSILCSNKYCDAFGTKFCPLGGTE